MRVRFLDVLAHQRAHLLVTPFARRVDDRAVGGHVCRPETGLAASANADRDLIDSFVLAGPVWRVPPSVRRRLADHEYLPRR